jgi:hypothetical protein
MGLTAARIFIHRPCRGAERCVWCYGAAPLLSASAPVSDIYFISCVFFYLLSASPYRFIVRRDVCASLPLFCNVGLHDSVPRLPWCHGNLGIARSSVLVFAFINRNCCRKANSVYTLRMEPRALCAGVGQCAFLWGPGRAPGGVCIMRAAHARRPSRRAASRGYCFPLSVRFVVTVHAKRT